MVKKQISNHKLCQLIVRKYVSSNTNWPKEIKIAKGLILKYKDYKFWNNLKDFKLPSLAWFLTKDGKNFLELQLKVQNLKIKKNTIFNIKDEKFGDDKVVVRKPKNLFEFLNQ